MVSSRAHAYVLGPLVVQARMLRRVSRGRFPARNDVIYGPLSPSPISLSLCLPVVAGIRSPIWSINPDHLSWCWTFLNCQIATLCFMTWKARSKLRGLLLYYQVLHYVNRFIQTYSIIVICVLFSPQKCLHVTCIVRNFLQLDASLYPIMIFLHHSLLTFESLIDLHTYMSLLGRNCLTSKSETQLI